MCRRSKCKLGWRRRSIANWINCDLAGRPVAPAALVCFFSLFFFFLFLFYDPFVPIWYSVGRLPAKEKKKRSIARSLRYAFRARR